MNKAINIGIDIGPTSVGLAAIENDTKEVYGKPIILRFADASDEKTGIPSNVSRREARHFRRRLNRKYRLRNDFITEWRKIIEKNLSIKNSPENDLLNYKYVEQTNNICQLPFELKLDAIINNRQLKTEEIFFCLYHYLHHRGFFYEKETISSELPSLLQKKFFEENNFINNSAVNSSFSNKEWKIEVEKFLKSQNFLNEYPDFQNWFLKRFSQVRDYATGPGSYKSILNSKKGQANYSEYSLKKEDFDESGNPINTLWDKMIGKCSIHTDEFRALSSSSSAELFNLLNDLNNIRINKIAEKHNQTINVDKWFITKKLKEQIILTSINENIKITPNYVAKIIASDFNVRVKSIELTGFRVDKSNKFLITDIQHTRTFLKSLNKNQNFTSLEHLFTDLNLINESNEIAIFLSKQKPEDAFIKLINNPHKDYSCLNNSTIKKFLNIQEESAEAIEENDTEEGLKKEKPKNKSSNLKIYQKTHAFSAKALNEINILLFKSESGENQSNILNANYRNIFQANSKINNNYLYFSKEEIKNITNEILSPSVKKSCINALKLLNLYLKKEIKNKNNVAHTITIELAREKNSVEEQKSIKEIQKFNEEINKKIKEYLEKYPNITNETQKKIFLWNQQQKKDAYDVFKEIKVEDIVNNPGAYQIDHIIPFSRSFDDSLNNKVLTSYINNKNKGDKTPYLWMNPSHFIKCEKEWENWYKDKKDFKKLWRLKNKEPLEKITSEFIGRNLSDTTYIGKILYTALKNKYENNKVFKIKILTTTGRFTNLMSKWLGFYKFFNTKNESKQDGYKKNRNQYKHHGLDALAIACSAFIPESVRSYISKNIENVNFENDWWDKYRENNRAIKMNLQKWNFNDNTNFRFSMPVLKNNTKAFFKAAGLLSAFKDKNNQVYKIRKTELLSNDKKDIKKLFSFFNEEDKSKLLIIKNKDINLKNKDNYSKNKDNDLFKALKQIFNKYYDEKNLKINPFYRYMLEKTESKIEDNPKFHYVKIDENKSINFAKTINIKYLKYLEKADEFKILKNHKLKYSKENKFSVFGSLNWEKIVILKEKSTNKLLAVPKNIKYKFTKETLDNDIKIINDNFGGNYELMKPINENNKFLFLYKNQKLISNVTGEIFCVNGIQSDNKGLEIKSLFEKNEKTPQLYVSLMNIFSNLYSFCDIDLLGNVYNKKSCHLLT